MKKIINGKVYDTEKAKCMGFDAGGDGFHSWREDLYKKRTGEFFLYGQGGAATKYAHYVDGNNAWSEGEKIIPMPYDKAREWAEAHLEADEYENIFGLPDEDDGGMQTLCINLPTVLAEKARINAAKQNISLSAYISIILKDIE